MERREFLAKSCVAGLASLAGGSMAVGQRRPNESDAAYRTRLAQERAAEAAARARMAGPVRDYFELRKYEIETAEQQAGFDTFAREAAIPALNRLGIKPVGVFYPNEGLSPIYVLLVHRSVESFATLTHQLSQDEEFLDKGSAFLDAPRDNPAYKSMEVSLHRAFEGMPTLERPVETPGRIFQLRIYESPSIKAGQKKIEMFNVGEIAVFRKTGLHPVFFGETLAGTKMPNLTYMLGFKDMEESKANWKQFGADPDWRRLRSMPEYADKAIIRQGGITNLYLKPAEYSQI